MFSKKKPVINTNYRSYLSPQSLKVHQLIQSPRFNIQKALQQQIERKRINEQKLARYDQYNSILAAKGTQGYNQNKKQQRSQLKMQSPSTLTTASPTNSRNITRCIFPNSSQKNQFNKPFHSHTQSEYEVQQQKYLQLLREKNKYLHIKNDRLRVYLREISSGVGQLESILEQVEGNYDKLKGMYTADQRESERLWLMEDDDEDEEQYQGQGEESLQLHQASVDENDTGDDKNTTKNKNNYTIAITQPEYTLTTSVIPQYQSQSQQSHLNLLQQIQTKFRGILERVSRQSEQQQIFSKNSSDIYELNQIEKQLDRIKFAEQISNSSNEQISSNKNEQISSYRNGSTILSNVQLLQNNKASSINYSNDEYLSPRHRNQEWQLDGKLRKENRQSKYFFS